MGYPRNVHSYPRNAELTVVKKNKKWLFKKYSTINYQGNGAQIGKRLRSLSLSPKMQLLYKKPDQPGGW